MTNHTTRGFSLVSVLTDFDEASCRTGLIQQQVTVIFQRAIQVLAINLRRSLPTLAHQGPLDEPPRPCIDNLGKP